jgi:Nucleotidyl transferase AbiEii toxin, Type IV TA system
MTAAHLDPFHRDAARIALAVAQRHGFVLGGGLAWVLRGLVQRPTEDVDLFSDVEGAAAAAADEVRATLQAAGYTVEDEDPDSDLGDLFDGFDLDQKEFLVSDGERTVRLSLSRLNRRHGPTVMDVGPVMHLDDLVATKVAALVNRREVRDYIDVAAALQHYTVAQLLDLAHRQDPGLDPEDIIDVGRYLDRLDDRRFSYYGLTTDQTKEVRRSLACWPRG